MDIHEFHVHCRGEFSVDNETYSVEPVDDTLTGRHRVYKESDSLLPPLHCGMLSPFNMFARSETLYSATTSGDNIKLGGVNCNRIPCGTVGMGLPLQELKTHFRRMGIGKAIETAGV